MCNKTAPESGYLEVLPEEECEYTFNIHTPKACRRKSAAAVECFAPGYAALGGMTSLRVPPVSGTGTGTVYLAVCGPISVDNQLVVQAASECPYGAAACVVHNG